MMQKEFSPALRIIEVLIKLTCNISLNNRKIVNTKNKISLKIDIAESLLIETNDKFVFSLWQRYKESLLENGRNLISVLHKIEKEINEKRFSSLFEVWETHTNYKYLVMVNLYKLSQIGSLVFKEDKIFQWKKNWEEVNVLLDEILAIGEEYKLNFFMAKKLTAKDRNRLIADVSRYYPDYYNRGNIALNEKQYIEVYNKIKNSQSDNPERWNRILSVLSEGIDESGENKIILQKWIEEQCA